MGLFRNIGTSFRLAGASVQLIFRHPSVLILPLFTLLWTMVWVVGPISFFVWLAENHPDAFKHFWATVYFLTVRAIEAGNLGAAVSSAIGTTYVLWAVWMTVEFTGALYFSTVGMDVATQQIRQPRASMPAAFRLANRNLGRLFLLALFNATFVALFKYATTFVFRLVPFAGRWLNRAFRLVLTAVTYLVLPIVVYERAGPVAAFRSAWRNVRKTWSGLLVGTGLVFASLWVLLSVFVEALVRGALRVDPWVELVLALALAGLVYTVGTSTASALRAALYWYATTGETPAGFRREDLPALQSYGPLATVASAGLVAPPVRQPPMGRPAPQAPPARVVAVARPAPAAPARPAAPTTAPAARRLVCPQCKAVNVVAANAKPACTSCGFGS